MLSPRRRLGFTLVELAVTLAVFAIVLAAMLPSLVYWVQGLAVRNVAESMQAGLAKTRMEALRRNADMSFWLVSSGAGVPLDNGCALSASGESWVISAQPPNGACLATPSSTQAPLLVERWSGTEAGPNVRVAATDGNGNASSSLTFNALGQVRPVGSPITQLDITHPDPGNRRLRLQVDAAGAIRLCDRDVGSADPRHCL